MSTRQFVRAAAWMLAASCFSDPSYAWTQERLPLLSEVAQVRRLTAEEARQKYPVHLRGVLTYYMPELGVTFFQDSTAGIYIKVEGVAPQASAGDLVEVDGVTGPGDFAPEVEKPRITVVGKAPLPHAQLFPLEELLTGRQDSQWVEIRGVVRSVDIEDMDPPSMEKGPPSLVLGIAAGNNKFKARIREFQHDTSYSSLIDAAVAVRGACATLFNERRQLVGIQLYVPGLEQVRIEEAARADAYALPIMPANSLMQFTQERASGHRLRVQGVVTFSRPRHFLVMQDSSGGVVVMSDQDTAVRLGDRIDAVGFPASGQYAPILEDAEYRRIGPGAAPQPADLTGATSLNSGHDAELVKVRGRVIDKSVVGEELVSTLQAGRYTIRVNLDNSSADQKARSIAIGSQLEVTGIWSVQTDEYRNPTSFK
ncbi:MAG TPA: OB-fold nucleic acid binding domain-containing protein, partial [Acidobacteriota bacterium]|nr:OB-fold nucleic acid binding domain-containing protein [Acidobacteriota bacterium]